jgi:hypothetical protein
LPANSRRPPSAFFTAAATWHIASTSGWLKFVALYRHAGAAGVDGDQQVLL